MNRDKNKKPELLAPAGNLDCALAALQSGADAVYAGISRFNAREMGENFSYDDMSKLSAYTKKNNKRLYITLNTLIKEQELDPFGESVEEIAALAPDAVIVQDIGVVRFLRKYFPAITIHGSTQMGIHNSAGVMTASDMGIKRVILERQITIDELEKICGLPVEIEVFVHGALCCSVSGHCLFSSWMGGWSGNRGRCKQPCRRRFHGEENGNKKSGFFFSTRDYYSLDMLDTLNDAGVCSLKIEGRLKKPDYVKSVVTAYRMMLDTPPESKAGVLREARAVLAGSYGRKWSHGFSTAEDMESLIQFESAGVSGRLVGIVEKTSRNGFEASISQRLHIGDRIRIQPRSGDEGPSITITKMSSGKTGVKTVSKGNRVFIHCDKEVKPRSIIYKIGESNAETVKYPHDMPLYSPPLGVQLELSVSRNGMKVTARPPEGPALHWSDDTAIDTAQNRPLDDITLKEAFSVTRNEDLSVSGIKAEIIKTDDGEDLFIPAGRLKKTRRAFWEWFESQHEVKDSLQKTRYQDNNWREKLAADKQAFGRSDVEKGPAAVFASGRNDAAPQLPTDRINVLDIGSFIKGPSRSVSGAGGIHELVLPFFCPEDRLEELGSMIKTAMERGIRRFRVTSLYQFSLLRKLSPPCIITTSFPLPATNSLAARELQELGAARVQLWLELDREALENAAAAWPVTPEIYRRGKPFLLATRAGLSIEGRITDSRGKEFFVEKPPVPDLDFSGENSPGALGFIFPAEVLSLPETEGCAEYYELIRVNGNESETGFNYDYTLI